MPQVHPNVPVGDEQRELARIVGEALRIQDRVEAIIRLARGGADLGRLAPTSRPLLDGLASLRERVDDLRDPALREQRERLDVILDHHQEFLSSVLELVAKGQISERSVRERRQLYGLGAPGGWLREMHRDLGAREIR